MTKIERTRDTFLGFSYNSIEMDVHLNLLNRLKTTTVTNAETVDWNAVYADLLPKIYNYFRYRVNDDPLAEDLTATTFEKAWRKRRRYRHDAGAFSTWIFTIAKNVATDYYRKHRDTLSLEENTALAQTTEETEESVQRRQDIARLAQLLAQLSPRERELIALKYGAGLTNRAIAKLTAYTESNVGTIIHRAVQKLRAQWEE